MDRLFARLSRNPLFFALILALGLIAQPVSSGELKKKSEAPPDGEAACLEPEEFFSTLEDIFGETGDSFRGALGMINFEKEAPAAPDPVAGYGLGVDDAVFEWKEFTLTDDATNCATGGSCATVDIESSNFYEGNALITITVMDSSPSNNDCNNDGDNTDPGDDLNCDNDGTNDVVVKVFEPFSEPAGEFPILEETATAGVYTGTIAVSASYDIPGVLFVAPVGTDNPTVTVQYFDYDDGTGFVCKNDVDPAAQGQVESFTTVFLTAGDLVITELVSSDNGDGDGIPDTQETVTMGIKVSNKNAYDVSNVTARLSTNSPWIDCVLDTFIVVGDIPAGDTITSSGSFRFRVSNDADRQAQGLTDLDDFSAELNFTLKADQLDVSSIPQSKIVDLDLDITGGGTPTTFFEGFEVASGLSTFTTMNIDQFMTGVPDANSDGFRCQFSDPDWVNSNSYGTPSGDTCAPSASVAQAQAFHFQVHQTSDIDGGRSYTGTRSLYYGIFGPAADEHTTPLSVLEAVRSITPIALNFQGADPELSMKHQISLDDYRRVVLPVGESTGRGVVMAQLADPVVQGAGSPGIGNWIKLEPFTNVYDQQGTDNYSNCLFDPTDDGTTEDDFFDPTDPDRRFGPSSTCFPAFSFTWLGDTFHGNPYSPGALGNAEGPGLCGGDAGGTGDPSCQGVGWGTWVESKFNMARYKGRYLRLRFLATELDNGTTTTMEAAFTHNPDPRDDGWWIDDVTVTNALTTPAVITRDDTNQVLAACGSTCGSVTAAVTVTPGSTLPAPGQAVTIDASASFADRCVDGTLQFRFSDNQQGLRRDWTDNPVFLDAPTASLAYTVDVRCSSDTSCSDAAILPVSVIFPSSGTQSCTTVTAALLATPDPVVAGNPVTLSATGSTVNFCSGGLEYQFWIDKNGNGASDFGTDTLVRDWAALATAMHVPFVDTTYLVNARCATETACNDSATDFVDVTGTCNVISDLVADDNPVLPGQAVELDATGSGVNTCAGSLEYRFWADGNSDGLGGDPSDTLIRDWTGNGILVVAPTVDTTYVVDVRCSTDTLCNDTTSLAIVIAATPICNIVAADLTADPNPAASGESVTLDASGSAADQCTGGQLQYKFWIDGDNNGFLGDPADTLLRDWGALASFIDAPTENTLYAVEVRCSTDPGCNDAEIQLVTISGGTVFPPASAPNKDSIQWAAPEDIAFVRGYLRFVSIYAINGGGTIGATDTLDISADDPLPGFGYWYLIKNQGEIGPAGFSARAAGGTTWGSGGGGEDPGRDIEVPSDNCDGPTPELWVVDSGSGGYTAVDSCNETILASRTLDTSGSTDDPRSIAFSTADGSAGKFSFITQGPFLHVVDAADKTVKDKVDVSALLPQTCSVGGNVCTSPAVCTAGGGDTCTDVEGLSLKGIDSARLQEFPLGAANPHRAFVYIAADVMVTSTITQPWFVVLDQDPLVASPLGGSILAQAGPLGTPPALDGTEALDVSTIAWPADPLVPATDYQRAWFTVRDTNDVHAVSVSTGDDAVWSAAAPVTSPVALALTPFGLVPGAARLGDLSILPEGPNGTLLDLDAQTTVCDFSIPGSNQRAVSITGPGGGSYKYWAVDRNGVVRVIDETDATPCTTADVYTVGTTPVAIATSGQDAPERGFVANNGDGTVSVLTDNQNTTSVTVGGTPSDVAVQTSTDTSCNIVITSIIPGRINWRTVGCDLESSTFFIYCRCNELDPANCPAECPQANPCPQCEDIGDTPWLPLGFTAGGSGQLSYQNGGIVTGADVEYNVTYDEREDYDVDPIP